MDQLQIGALKSFDDFNATISEREIRPGDKKEVRKSIPFSNRTYDFSKINGELYWEDAELTYEFEILAESPDKLEENKRKFKNWIMNVFEQPLYDPHIADFHYIATFSEIDIEDDESMLKSTIEAVFVAYPYMIANKPTMYYITGKANVPTQLVVKVDSSHPVSPTIECSTPITIVKDQDQITFPAGKHQELSFKLHDIVELTVNSTEDFSLKLSFNNEVL